jgi:quinoprotein glucose dehydrogenase
VKEGAKDAGVFMAERHGMVVTSTGLLFIAATDGKVRAHDADSGKVLWTASLPAGSEGLPAMYAVDGRQFLVVPASSRINTGGGHRLPGAETADEPRNALAAYVAFALPRK